MRVLVLGAAASGMAAARLARSQGAAVVVYDERPDSAASLLGAGFGAVTGRWDPLTLDGVELVVASPGFAERSLPVVETLEAGVRLISELEYGWLRLRVPTVAVTGTNGKTTVTGLVSQMLTESGLVAPPLGNIGDPVSDAAGDRLDRAVIEASSFQLRFIEEFHAEVAVITNIAPDHLDWHGSFDAYVSAKRRIVENQTSDDLVVYDGDDEGATTIATTAPGRLLPVSGTRRTESGYGPADGRLYLGDGAVELSTLGVSAPAFLMDLAAAAAAAAAAGADREAIAGVVRGFRPGNHRRTEVASYGGVTFIDDSKASNPHAALAAIRSYPSVVLIAGGRAKGLDVSPLATEPAVRGVVAIGESAPELLEAAGGRGVPAGDMTEAVALAVAMAQPGDVVLLAPGCASWDMFDSYAERGQAFADAIEAMVAKETAAR